MSRILHLLEQARGTLVAARRLGPGLEQDTLFNAVDQVLQELMARDAVDFYERHLQEGLRLLGEGSHLCGGNIPESDALQEPDDGRGHGSDAPLARIHAVHARLCAIVRRLDGAGPEGGHDYLERLSAWESALYRHGVEYRSGGNPSGVPAPAAEAVAAYLRRRFPERRDLRIGAFMQLPGGFSKTTILFDAVDADRGAESLVMRAEQPSPMLHFEGSDVTREFHMVKLMQRSGIPVAEPLWLESDPDALGMRFIVSRKAEGRTLGGNLGSNVALGPAHLESVLSTLARLHLLEPDPADPLLRRSHLDAWIDFPTVGDATHHYVTGFLPRLIEESRIDPSPQLLRALLWLQRNVPRCDERPVIVHLDFALNNLIFDGERIRAVLDWESSRMGDPAEDVTWTQQNLAQWIDMDAFMRAYGARTGKEISAYRLAYARVSKSVLNSITCLSAKRILEQEDSADVRLAVFYGYMPVFGSQFNLLIGQAEAARNG